MPREYVYAEYKTDDKGQKVAPQMALSIGWQKDHNTVQIGTIRNGKEQSFEPENGLYLTFNSRRQVNDAIRLLQRGRDSAFGRDA